MLIIIANYRPPPTHAHFQHTSSLVVVLLSIRFTGDLHTQQDHADSPRSSRYRRRASVPGNSVNREIPVESFINPSFHVPVNTTTTTVHSFLQLLPTSTTSCYFVPVCLVLSCASALVGLELLVFGLLWSLVGRCCYLLSLCQLIMRFNSNIACLSCLGSGNSTYIYWSTEMHALILLLLLSLLVGINGNLHGFQITNSIVVVVVLVLCS